jgi:glutamine cyclotransferase
MPKKAHMKKSACLPILVLLPVLIFEAFVCAAQAESASFSSGAIPIYGFKIINTYPHNSSAFTQGLVYDEDEGVLYESLGLYGKSSLCKVELKTGRVLRQTILDSSQFGEGLTIWKDRLIQLTWQSGLGLVYGKENMIPIGNFSYKTEGWGITSDGRRLIMSDGTEKLHILDPETFSEQGVVRVISNGLPLQGLNELEYIKGGVYANMWPTSQIVIISPDTGNVLGIIDLQGILQESGGQLDYNDVDVLNGIAYDSLGDRLFVTGKLWPKLFEIRLIQRTG